MRFNRTRRSPIGIDVGTRYVKAVQLSGGHGSWRIEAAVSIPCREQNAPLDGAAIRRVCDVLDRQGFVGRDVVLAAPRDKVLSGVLELPPRSSGAPLEQLARMELARTYKCEPNSFEISSWDVPAPVRSNDSTHLMAVACAHEEADTLLDIFEAEQFNCVGMDVQAWALARACAPLAGDPENITGMVDIGWTSASQVALHQGLVVYVRHLAEAGVAPLDRALARYLEADEQVTKYVMHEIGLNTELEEEQAGLEQLADARGILSVHFDAMLNELRASLSYATHCYPDASVQRLLLVGGGASIPRLAEAVGSELGAETRTVAPRDLVECAPALLERCGEPALVGALGLAQYE